MHAYRSKALTAFDLRSLPSRELPLFSSARGSGRTWPENVSVQNNRIANGYQSEWQFGPMESRYGGGLRV